jgi:RNA polymerase sigma factor (sigma-70 family)
MPIFTEEDIITGCKENNRVAQERLYKQNYNLFLKLCARYAKDMHDAEQLAQDSFLKIFHHIESYQGNGSFDGWMRRIVVNTCLDYLKSKYLKNTKQLYFPEEMSENGTTATNNLALEKFALKDLLEIVQSLSPMSRTVFNLYAFEGYSHREISTMLEISEGTSQWHVNNARKNLQQKIKQHQNKEFKRHEQSRI